ncbi:hypothetical protein ES332_A13G162200v1 [Gossypium tomentosum]|uniref:Uncharacterized protein n=1 Tax=Gossypium tomentosum TaxID=34277 RepID=A0A5D2ML87_GOSTO|nr:hypothetical protein ES332_A13G162200v1 [Gossypium tomentosum]
MFLPKSLTITISSISLKKISLIRLKNSIAGIPSMMEVLTSLSNNSKSLSFPSVVMTRSEVGAST